MAARAFLGSGSVYIARQTAGVFGPYEGPFLADKFGIKPNSTLKEKISKATESYGQPIESVSVPAPFDLNIDLAEVNTSSLAIAMMGTVAGFTQTGGTLAAVDVVSALDAWTELTKANLTGSPAVGSAAVGDFTGAISTTTLTVTVAPASGTLGPGQILQDVTTAGTRIVRQLTSTETDTSVMGGKGTYLVDKSQTFASGTISVDAVAAYEEGVDYIVNERLGWFKALSGGALLDGQVVQLTMTYGDITADDISGASVSEIRARIKFDGVNLADNGPSTVTVHEAVLSVTSEFDWLASDFANVSMTGRMKIPTGFTEPFTVRQTAVTA